LFLKPRHLSIFFLKEFAVRYIQEALPVRNSIDDASMQLAPDRPSRVEEKVRLLFGFAKVGSLLQDLEIF